VRRRITTAIVGVTALVLLMLGIPLAVVAQRSIMDSEVVELQSLAAQTLTEIDVPIDPVELDRLNSESDDPPPFGIYEPGGRLAYGTGPAVGDDVVLAAFAGTTTSSTDGTIVVGTPITDRDEHVVAVLRLSESLSDADDRAQRTWLIMAAAAILALGVAWVIARRLATRLSRPIVELADRAGQLGHDGTLAAHRPTGIAEIDALGEALVEGSERINEALARERRFSADVSHQLRTPLSGLRLRLEAAQQGDDAGVVGRAALDDLTRLEGTVTHLLAFARDAIPTTSTCSLSDAATSAAARWQERAMRQHRAIIVAPSSAGGPQVRAAARSVEQVLDVLVDNALHHGSGTITVAARRIGGGGAIDVTDDGSISAGEGNIEADIFRRGHGAHHGIGLALARSIAEAEGGRLLLARRRPTTFSLILLGVDD